MDFQLDGYRVRGYACLLYDDVSGINAGRRRLGYVNIRPDALILSRVDIELLDEF